MNTDQNENTETPSQKKPHSLRTILPFFVIILFILGGGLGYQYFFLSDNGEVEQAVERESETSEPSGGRADYVLEEVPVETIENVQPNLNRVVQFDESLPEDARAILEGRIHDVKERLREDPARGGDWLELGVLYHSTSDFDAAREVWEFLVEVSPEDTTSYDNLAKLYHFQLRDFPKSENYFERSLVVDSNNLNAYLGLHELYRYSYKQETTLASDIIRTAMEIFPNEYRLYITLGSYYRDSGSVEEARTVLIEGLDKARDAGNVDMITALGAEIERLQ